MYAIYESPIGKIILESDSKNIVGLNFLDGDFEGSVSKNNVLKKCMEELDAYFKGELKNFSVQIKYSTTDFRQKVYEQLIEIPYGTTVSYSDIANAIDNPKAVRAVGMANNKNNISIIVPCHRVIGKNGKLVGYGGGIWRKTWLLEHEQKYLLD